MKKDMIDLRPVMENDDIKEIFKDMIASGKVNAFITGPKQNVLKCATVDDWVTASHILQGYGVSCLSPGGYGGPSPNQRKKTHNDIYRHGIVCAVSFDCRTYIFQIRTEGKGYLHALGQKQKAA
jgi:hypothetical protein